MFGDVRDPSLFGSSRVNLRSTRSLEVEADAWKCTLVSRKSFHTSGSHQQLDAAVSNSNSVTKGEFFHELGGHRRCHARRCAPR